MAPLSTGAACVRSIMADSSVSKPSESEMKAFAKSCSSKNLSAPMRENRELREDLAAARRLLGVRA